MIRVTGHLKNSGGYVTCFCNDMITADTFAVECFDDFTIIEASTIPKFYTKEELSEILKISVATINHRMAHDRDALPRHKKHGNRIVFLEEEVNKFLRGEA